MLPAQTKVGKLCLTGYGIPSFLSPQVQIFFGSSIAHSPKNVTDLTKVLALPQSLVSRHLKVLRERGMVAATRKGPAVEYRLTDMRLVNALDLLRAVLHDNLSHRAKLATHLE
jgi:DNA-binding transcriptional ArsR family regulator